MKRPASSILFAAADEQSSAGGATATETAQTPTVAEAIRAIDDKTLPLGQRLTVAANALRGIDPTGQLATIKGDLDKAKTDLSARDTEINDLQARVADLEKQLAAREQDVAAADEARAAAEKRAAELEAKEQDLEQRAAAKAKEKLGALGVKSTDLPKQDPKHEEDDKKSAEARIRELPGTKRAMAAIYFKQTGKLPDWMAQN